ncbi:MAG: hypothetical protein B7Y25_03715 [Alphaproteobacteria bacterium 16-39-46]|nr:MAG: hypothetical protein B7Y25_03715 [Alphaproteobacteria bacterium 16-39-46]OZA43159.1 MAG: hypothetical protein B7X84_03940 [Alphaproteobacteria bacterium 17-39-52]HQS84007.1 uroporphyrinogen-III synthase [Alphaproteobacteria bacterium]HQS93887.1 uroporphyrinogen-III synthase [Alphaproteobacteria bacterium]
MGLKRTMGILWTHTSFQKEKLGDLQSCEETLKIDFFYDPLLIIKQLVVLKAEDLEEYQGVFVTSQHALMSLKDVASLNFSIYTVGKRTFEVAEQLGFKTIFSAQGRANDLKNLLLKERDSLKGGLLYLRGKHIQEDLKKELEREGFKVQEKIVYEALLKKSFLDETVMGFRNKKITEVFLFSRRGAMAFEKNFKALEIENGEKNLRVFCLSPEIALEITKKTGQEVYKGIYAAQRPTLESLWTLFCETVKF